MLPQNVIPTRHAIVAELVLALSLLSACSHDSSDPVGATSVPYVVSTTPTVTPRTGTQVLWTTARVGGARGLDYYAAPREGDVVRGGSDAGFVTP